jgi:hypothetical protein
VKVRDGFGFVPSVIEAVAEAEGADLIALASHGSGGPARLLLGSVATGVLQRALVPVLVVRPAAVRADAAPPAPVPAGTPGRRIPLPKAPESERRAT